MTDMLPKHMERGAQRRLHVLQQAVDVATIEGLEALTIGRIAQMGGFTKAGLLGHFKSKEELQLATLKAGRDAFFDAVVEPARQDPPGLARAALLLNRWITRVARTPGGCFFASVAAEFDGREGPVRDAIAQLVQEWLQGLEFFLREALKLGHLKPETDIGALVFRLHGYEMSFNLRRQLLHSADSESLTRAAIQAELLNSATFAGKKLLAAHPITTIEETAP